VEIRSGEWRGGRGRDDKLRREGVGEKGERVKGIEEGEKVDKRRKEEIKKKSILECGRIE